MLVVWVEMWQLLRDRSCTKGKEGARPVPCHGARQAMLIDAPIGVKNLDDDGSAFVVRAMVM
jgi:hypothetical protein